MRKSGATATSAKPPSMQPAATRSPSLRPEPSGALRTTPATSLPGTNGSGGLNLVLAAGLQHLGERDPGGVHVDHHAASGGEHVGRLWLGEVHLRQGGARPRQVDDLDGSHAGVLLEARQAPRLRQRCITA